MANIETTSSVLGWDCSYSSSNNTTNRLDMPLLGTTLVILVSMVSLVASCIDQERSSLLQFV